MPAELTIASVKELFLQISLAPTNGPASLDIVKAPEIRELQQFIYLLKALLLRYHFIKNALPVSRFHNQILKKLYNY